MNERMKLSSCPWNVARSQQSWNTVVFPIVVSAEKLSSNQIVLLETKNYKNRCPSGPVKKRNDFEKP